MPRVDHDSGLAALGFLLIFGVLLVCAAGFDSCIGCVDRAVLHRHPASPAKGGGK